MDSATSDGSLGFSGNGFPVFVLQNLHERVQMSPPIINVAVPRPQHSPILGHLPLEQIVCKQCDSTIFRVCENLSFPPNFIFSQSGFFICSMFYFLSADTKIIRAATKSYKPMVKNPVMNERSSEKFGIYFDYAESRETANSI
jgi:hypothetical protein